MIKTLPSKVFVLLICQTLYTASVSIDLTLTGLVGYTLAKNKLYATLPYACITFAVACSTFFASKLMYKYGRKVGFLLASMVATISGLLSALAIYHQNFVMFCCSTLLIGIFQSFAQYYRLAAADEVILSAKSQAISIVMCGGVIAAVFGPIIAKYSKGLIHFAYFAGSYVMVSIFGLVSFVILLLFYHDKTEHRRELLQVNVNKPRPLFEILKQPIYITAVVNSAIGYFIMMLLMTITPIAMVQHQSYNVNDGVSVIQWHMVGMYAPALFAMFITRYKGNMYLVYLGIIFSILSVCLSFYSFSLSFLYVSLLTLGIGWCFMYIGGTTLLSLSYEYNERATAQSFSELITFLLSALGSLCSGVLLHFIGWRGINLLSLSLLLVVLSVTLNYQRVLIKEYK